MYNIASFADEYIRLESTTAIPPSHLALQSLRSANPNPLANEREHYGPSTHYLQRYIPSQGYAGYPDTPRACQPSGSMSMSTPGPGYNPSMMVTSPAGPSHSGSQPHTDCSEFPFPDFSEMQNVLCEGQVVSFNLDCKVDKGFFLAEDRHWTCYRRNYFSVNASYQMSHVNPNAPLMLSRDGKLEEIRAIGINITAAVDGPTGKGVDLIQHTPKRDAGPKTPVRAKKVLPTPLLLEQPHQGYGTLQSLSLNPPLPLMQLPFQTQVDVYPDDEEKKRAAAEKETSQSQSPRTAQAWEGTAGPQGQVTTANFERVQFKSATANNGKRRASQQFFHIKLEVVVDIRKNANDLPQWVKVAERTSGKVVVRGRSPSHYHNEGTNGNRHRNTTHHGHNAGAQYAAVMAGPMPGPAYPAIHPLNTGGFRSQEVYPLRSTSQITYAQDSNYGHGTMFSPVDSESPAGSVDAGASDEDHYTSQLMQGIDMANVGGNEYSYHPSPIYETHTQSHLQLPPPKTESQHTTEPRQHAVHAVNAEYPGATPGPNYTAPGPARFEGYPTSRGWYPTALGGEQGQQGPPTGPQGPHYH